jgi:hypothetical protein
MRKCEYELCVKNRNLNKPQFEQKCSLTGHSCLSFDEPQHCTRRTHALEYEARHPTPLGKSPTVVCSEDSPKPPLPGTWKTLPGGGWTAPPTEP